MTPKLNSTEKVLMILQAFLPDSRPRGTLELGHELSINPGTISRILSILKKYDFVQQDMDRKYQLGEVAGKLGDAFNESKTARQISVIRPQLMVLNSILNENVHLELLYGNTVRLAIILQGSKTVQPVRRSESWTGINAAAGAKAILAFLTPNRLKVIKKAHPILQKFRPNTITDWSKLEEQLKEIREAGVAYDRDEHVEGICAVAVPLFDSLGSVFGAITVPVPLQREEIILEQKTISLLKETAGNITASQADLP